MIEDEWIIKKVKYDGTVSIVFTNGDIDAEYSLKCEEKPRPKFIQALKDLRYHFRAYISNPIKDCDHSKTQMAIHTINYRYKDGELDKVNFVCTVRNDKAYEGEMTISGIMTPTRDAYIDKDLETIAHEANEYIAGHRAQMGLWDGDEHVD